VGKCYQLPIEPIDKSDPSKAEGSPVHCATQLLPRQDQFKCRQVLSLRFLPQHYSNVMPYRSIYKDRHPNSTSHGETS